MISFHFKREPSVLEQKMSLPLGLVFWLLSLVCLFAGLANYLKTSVLPKEKNPCPNQRMYIYTYIPWAPTRAFALVLPTPADERCSIQLYSKKRALVQSGLKTQVVSFPLNSPNPQFNPSANNGPCDLWPRWAEMVYIYSIDTRDHHRRHHRDLSRLSHYQRPHE